MLKILSFEEYAKRTTLPKTNDLVSQRISIEKDIADATNMLDNFCAGKIFIEFPLLDTSIPTDVMRIEKLLWAIVETTRLINITGKSWFNLNQSISSQISTTASYTSQDSNVEFNRQDIIANLVAGKWYKNLRTDEKTNNLDNPLWDKVEQANLDLTYLRRDGSNSFDGFKQPNLNMMNNKIINSGDIVSDWNQYNAGEYRNLVGFNLLGSVEKSTHSEMTDKILVRNALKQTQTFQYLDEVDIHLFNGLTAQETYKAISASELSWQETQIYALDQIVVYIDDKNFMRWVQSLISDNINHNPKNTDANLFWRFLEVEPIDTKLVIEEIIKELRMNVLPKDIKKEVETQLNVLPTTKNIIFKKGVKYDFQTKAIFDEICKANNILEQDYMLYENSTIFGVGENGEVVGDGMLKSFNLPRDMKLELGCYSLFNGSIHNSTVRFVDGYGGILSSRDTWPGQGWGGIASNNVNWSTTRFTIYLNGNVEQTQFIPKYKEVYSVMFLKDIEREQLLSVNNLSIDFSKITGDILNNASAKYNLEKIYNGKTILNQDNLYQTNFRFLSVDPTKDFSNNFIGLRKSSDDFLELNYNIKDNSEVFSGNYLNGKKIYLNRVIVDVVASTDTVILHNIENLVNVCIFIKIGDNKKLITNVSQINDGLMINSIESGIVEAVVSYTKRNGETVDNIESNSGEI